VSEHALELEPDPELLSLQFRLQRMLEVVAREPELEPWQVAERFGVAESTAAKALRGESFLYGALGPDDPVRIGARFGKLVVLEILTSAESGHHHDGAWCQVVCDCGLSKQVRAKHLRSGGIRSCGAWECFWKTARTDQLRLCPHCGRSLRPCHLGPHLRVCSKKAAAP
jgi:hypothetical protein